MENSSSEFGNILKRHEEEKINKSIEMTCKTNLLDNIRSANLHGKKTDQAYSGRSFYKDIHAAKGEPEYKHQDALK